MRKTAIGVGALILAVASALVCARTQSSAAAGPASTAPRESARPAPQAGFAKASSRKTQTQKAQGQKRHGSKSAAKDGSKGHPAKKRNSRNTEANKRPKPGDSFRAQPLQFHGGAAGLFAGSPFTRPASAGRLGLNAGNHPYGGFVGWFGPVYWPYAYDDLFAYVFWPSDSFDDGEAFWAFAYDDLFEGIFWADAALEPERGEDALAAAEADALNSDDRSRAEALGPEGPSREFAQICGERTLGFTQWPILRIAQSVGLAREQRTALKNLQAGGTEAARRLRAACPAATATTPIGRLNAISERVDAMLQATTVVRPALEKFYTSLGDQQKARFRAEPPAIGGQAVSAAASGEDELVPQICTDHPGGLSVQTIERIDQLVGPIAAQRAALDELRIAAARAAAILRAACPGGTPVNPLERLAAMQQRLGAMLDAVGLLRPALQNFYGSLTDGQKGRFDAAGKQAGHFAD
jgi:LTXXQ motif family protein